MAVMVLILGLVLASFSCISSQGQQGSNYTGCYKDGRVRDFSGYNEVTDQMTIEHCTEVCVKKGFLYVGLQVRSECFCGNTYGLYGKANEKECNMPCSGNQSQICGGRWRNSVYVRFSIDPTTTVPTTTITAAPTTKTTECGGMLTAERGNFASPNHPTTYPDNVNCTWHIKVPHRQLIKLTFNDFHLEPHHNSDCAYDYVGVSEYAVVTTNEISQRRYCGDKMPQVLTSTQNGITVRFVSDGSKGYQGFSASYVSSILPVECGGRLTDHTGNLMTPGYPNMYRDNVDCTWRIEAKPNQVIKLTFHAFQLEPHRDCNSDYVEVVEYSVLLTNRNETSLGRYCGTNVPSLLTSSQMAMTVRFVSDINERYQGFRASYTILNTLVECGGVLSAETGNLMSPGYPNMYTNNLDCTWYIEAKPNQVIKLTFHTFQLDPHRDCDSDYVELSEYSVLTRNETTMGRYCGMRTPLVLTSTQNGMIVRLVSDGSTAYQGFRSAYTILN